VPALVELTSGMDVASVAGLPLPGPPLKAVFRVPLTRIQTALRFQPLSPVDAADPVAGRTRQLNLARTTAQRSAADQAVRLAGRPARVAAAEASALASPECGCVIALVVNGDREALDALVRTPGVRAVDAAPVGTPADGVSLSPLLPEQSVTAGPVPDDGPPPS
jgi:hypothetical protein